MALGIDLSGQVAIVTGGSKGIGLAIAHALGSAGCQVVVASRKQEAIDAAVAELTGAGVSALGVPANVGDSADRERLIKTCVDKFGKLDILVNNAAANPVYGPVEDTETWAFAKIMQVNVEAPFELAKLALPHLEASENGNVVNISSIGGLRPEPKLGIYSVSKTALNGLTRVLAKEWGPRGIRVNGICPGLIKTDFSEALWSDDRVLKHMKAMTPLSRIGEPAEIGNLVATVVSGFCGYVTGQLFTADGGYTI